ncbi:MAG: hypothetical protein KKB81_06630 [Candidatus Margulisbacteria bacterium]|nr:hypothetical protein [Candidatus Margulisiibacteriota bacterium]MBU1728456.1 hypothetical protein [Candidatus Margulisiibacteriota bacterium]
MPMIELDIITTPDTEEREVTLSSDSFYCPGNVWISDDRKEVIVTSGNITFHDGREFSTGSSTEKTDLDCALQAFQRGFSGYSKKV